MLQHTEINVTLIAMTLENIRYLLWAGVAIGMIFAAVCGFFVNVVGQRITERKQSVLNAPVVTQSAVTSGANSPVTQIGSNNNVTVNQQGGVTILGHTELLTPPTIPEIQLKTSLEGIKFDALRAEISSDHVSQRRLHTLTIHNSSKASISQLEIRTQFPEPIIQIVSDASPAMGFLAKEHWDNPLITVKGNMPNAKYVSEMTTGVWKIQVGRIPGNTTLVVEILSAVDSKGELYYSAVGERSADEKPIIWIMTGSFQFQKMGADESKFFITQLGYDIQKREATVIKTIEGEADSIPWLEVTCMPGVDMGHIQTYGSILTKLHGAQLPGNLRPFVSVEKLDAGGQSTAIGEKK